MTRSSLPGPIAILMLTSAVFAADSIGWRRDGTGIYPQTDPPTQWQQTSKSIAALRFQAAPPKGEEPSGKPMADGVIREWLILGPIADMPDDAGNPTDPLFALDQSKLAPAPDQKAAGAQWKLLAADTAYIDFARVFETYGKKDVQQAAYAHAYIYSPEDAPVILNVMYTASIRIWLNGKLTHKPTETDLSHSPQFVTLHKGWNQLLLRSTPKGPSTNEGRPLNGTWNVNITFHAAPPKVEYVSKNIRWKTQLPADSGFGGPIFVQGKVILQSEMADLVCLDADSGKILWVRSNNYDQLATDAEKAAHPDVFQEILLLRARLDQVNDSFAQGNPPKLEAFSGREGFKEKTELEKQIGALMLKIDAKKYLLPAGQDVGYAGFTPISDGRSVWAWFANGVTCCYDLDGKLIWRRLDNNGKFFEHGYSVSPILADGKLVVFMNKLMAFDAVKGDNRWTTDLSGLALTRFHGTPAVAKIANEYVAMLPPGHIVRLFDGKIIRGKGPEISPYQQEIPSPVAIGNTFYKLSTYGKFHKVVLPAQNSDPFEPASVQGLSVDLTKYPTHYLEWFLASPLIHDGLAYCVNNTGVLAVFDLETMQVVYEKLLDLDHYQHVHDSAGRGIGISPALAGDRIYLIGNTGAALVIKPGRTYEQLAKNKIESVLVRYWGTRPERFVAAPTFDGKRMFLRGERYLYCIGE